MAMALAMAIWRCGDCDGDGDGVSSAAQWPKGRCQPSSPCSQSRVQRRGTPQVGGWGVANVITAQCNLVSERGEQETRCMPREHEQHGS